MKSLKEALVHKHMDTHCFGPYRNKRDIWFEEEPKLTVDEIEGYIIDTIYNIKTNEKYIKNIKTYLNYIIDELNIVARCKEKKISDMAAHALTCVDDKDLFNEMVKIAKEIGLSI